MKTFTVKSSAHRAAKQAGLTKEQYEIVEVDGKFGYKLIVEEPVVEEPAPEKRPAIKHKSDIDLPTKTVWRIADEMFAANPEVRRKDVINECVNRGIAFYTARTQYQQWHSSKFNAKK